MASRSSLLLACWLIGAASAYAIEPSPSEVLEVARCFVSSARACQPFPDSRRALAGAFSRHPKLEQSFGPLTNGDVLHLFPDESYILLRFGDILSPTIYDRGAWRFDERYVRLTSDGSLPREHAISGAFLPFLATVAGTESLFLLDLAAGLPRLRAEHDTDELALLSRSRARLAAPPAAEALRIKQRLLRTAWRPDFFR